ncbi:MAG: hypothetical protein C4532_08725 [Candidatus Abyssobacteria bacterium SURF_17]|uniref:AAA domain-containing protein n=1 Tax=Candidatus Abyssobacteria bacterium SURF_17 TaxID=2093361 RepID=A0A419EZC8_9BACT|nr:MAG: hypothetical protein C4532_08725 [Candidatus Abyssubacteria bacterium SURF_17]
MENHPNAEKAARLIGIEPSRLRFLELYCQEFLSPFTLIPRTYLPNDLKILAAANRLFEQGVAPNMLIRHLAAIVTHPSLHGSNGLASSCEDTSSPARLVAVASGKGGVGKSTVALNLGVELVRQGLRVIVVDADFGVANLHVLAGLKEGKTIRDVMSGAWRLEDIIAKVTDGPDIVPGASGILELANLPAHKRRIFLSELRKLDARYDVIIVDVAAGVSDSVLDFVVAADFVLVVMTPETTAITDAYALIKLSMRRSPCCRIGVVANRVRSAREGREALVRISQCTHRFLGRRVLDMGNIWEDSRVRHAVNERVALSIRHPDSRASLSIRKLARMLLEQEMASARSRLGGAGLEKFITRCLPLAAVADGKGIGVNRETGECYGSGNKMVGRNA